MSQLESPCRFLIRHPNRLRYHRVMRHPHTIFVTSLFDMPHFVRELAPARLVSIIQPELQPARPSEISASNHLRVGVHDISEHRPHSILARRRDVEELIGFIESWNPEDGALLTHCYAGVSRSTATALIAAFVKTSDAEASAGALRTAAPHALPNRHLIALADEVLGCNGALIAARETMGGASVSVADGPLTILRL